MKKENLEKTIEGIENNIQKEFEGSISKIIGRVFDVTIQPILNLIPKLVNKISIKLEQKKIKKTMKFAVNSHLLRNYLDKKHLDIIVLLTHNGKKSETGVSYKYLRKLFYKMSETNNLLDLLLENSSPIDLFDDWLVRCERGQDIYKADFDNKMLSYFGNFNYEAICFRRYRTAFYLILCGANLPTQNDELYVMEEIDKLLK